MIPHYRVTFAREPGARWEIAVPASDPDTGYSLGRARLLLALGGDAEALSDWAVHEVRLVSVPTTMADL